MSYDERELLADYKRLLESNKLSLGIIENLMTENDKLKNLRDELLKALVDAKSLLEELEQFDEKQAFRNAQIDTAIIRATNSVMSFR